MNGSLPADRPWQLDGTVVARTLGVDPASGLTAHEARERLTVVGPNVLRRRARTSAWLLLLGQFTNAMIIVLMIAMAITVALGDLKDAIVIGAILVINGIVGFVQEYRAEQAMEALARLTSPTATVVRDGRALVVPAAELVPGDIVRLAAGDVVAADARLLETQALRIDESALTGESEPAGKSAAPLPDVVADALADQRNVAFSGTHVTYGRGAGVVIATGMATALGRIADLLQENEGGSTPLQRRLDALGKRLALAAGAICGLVFVTGLLRGEAADAMFLTAVSLAVAAVPEGLPAVVTIALALGARRMARHRALIRRLPAVETLGSVTIVCSDKTGTLTENRMVVERIWTPLAEYAVSGDGYAPEGRIEPEPVGDPFVDRLALVGAACNDASLHAPVDAGAPWTIAGDPTEAALVTLALKRGVDAVELRRSVPRVEELTFDPERRRMATIHRDGAGLWVAVKGGVESVAPLLTPEDRAVVERALDAAERFASDGYRVLALAERSLDRLPARLDDAERDLRLVGLVGMTDPPRASSRRAIDACRAAGITPVMITGDHPSTARAIATRLGILERDDTVLTGAELGQLDEGAFRARLAHVRVYARTNPEQKLRIVEAWSDRGAVVAMTGDGVNDAPALKRADIGVAMGLAGTEVSKEAADMVLANDDFASIVEAVEEGRRIYDNIRRFVRYLLTTNSAELWVMVLAPFLGLPLPLVAVQILWINLVTDGLPALALGVEPPERDTMRRPPRRPGESILGAGLWQQAVWVGLLMAGATLAIQAIGVANGWPWGTMVFTTLALLQLGNALAVRSDRASFLSLGPRSNLPLTAAVVGTSLLQILLVYLPIAGEVFGTEPLDPLQLAIVLAASSVGFVAVELEKWLRRGGTRHTAPLAA